MSISSMASAAVSSSTAATARIGSPWYSGSMVSAILALLVGLDDRAQIGDAVGGRRQVILRKNRFDPGHGQRLAQIKMFHASVRHRTQQQLAEQHAFGAEVFGILRLAGHFRVEIRRGVVLADELVLLRTLLTRLGVSG